MLSKNWWCQIEYLNFNLYKYVINFRLDVSKVWKNQLYTCILRNCLEYSWYISIVWVRIDKIQRQFKGNEPAKFAHLKVILHTVQQQYHQDFYTEQYPLNM